jgi:endonuclease/exonuclease/phosphatase family metal-dependent hydrolase
LARKLVLSVDLRVMTFNLLTSTKKRRRHPWRLRRKSIARIFQTFQPDVVGTQEANYQQLQDLGELLPEYGFQGSGNLGRSMAHSDSNWYCAVFFKRDRVRPLEEDGVGDVQWLSPTPEVPASQFHLGTRPRVVHWSIFALEGASQPFVFGTTHLEAVNAWHRRRSTHILKRYVSRMVRELGPGTPVFLTGDFNAVAESPEIAAMSREEEGQAPLFDAWSRANGPETAAGATFRGLGLRDRMGRILTGPRRIDYVFYRPELQLLQVDLVDYASLEHRESALPSDHYPVIADFRLA